MNTSTNKACEKSLPDFSMKYLTRLAALALLIGLGPSAQAESPQAFYNVISYGAKPDGATLSTRAINDAIAGCSAAAAGTVIFPAGKTLSGSIDLRQNVTLQLEAGAVIVASTNLDDYALEPAQGNGPPSRRACSRRAARTISPLPAAASSRATACSSSIPSS